MNQKIPWLLGYLILISISLFGQRSNKDKHFDVFGNASIQIGTYGFNSTDSTFRPRRPSFDYRLVVNPTIQITKKFSLPINIILSKRQQNILFPLPETQNPIEYITNPNNSIGLSPTFGNLQFHLGTHNIQLSGLTLGNIPVFGGGIDYNGKGFQIAASYGFANWGMESDSLNNVLGAYRRKIYAARTRLGKVDKTYVGFNFAKMEDDPGSLENPLVGIPAEEGMLGSMDIRIGLGKHVFLKGEGAVSAFSTDTEVDEIEDREGISQFTSIGIFKFRYSTLVDYAVSGSLNINFEKVGLKTEIKNISPGFRTFGYPFLRTDMQDITASPYVNLFSNKVRINGTIGYRTDNLNNTKISPSTNLLLSGNIFAQITKKINLNANYSNFGLRNNIDNDTLKVESVSRNFTISPTFIFQSDDILSNLTITYGRSSFEDFNFITELQNQNNTNSITGVFTWAYKGYSFAVNSSYIDNQRATDELQIKTGGLRIGYAINSIRLRLATSFLFTQTTLAGFTSDNQTKIQPSIRWGITKKITWQLSYFWRSYQYGSLRDNGSFSEQFLQTSINQRF